MKITLLQLTGMSIIGYIISRGFIELGVITYFRRKGYKSYKKQATFAQRYWLTWMKKNARVKYLKSEKRNIDYPTIMTVYFYTHNVMFSSLIIILLLVSLVLVDVLDMKYAEIAITLYLIEIILSFVTYYFIVTYEHRKFHRKRNKR